MSGAINVNANGAFSGNDGKWSTFPFQIGTPAQFVNLIPATSAQETWVIAPHACGDDDDGCRNGRGHLFNWSSSNTWSELGTYKLKWNDGNEVNLSSTRVDATGYFGFETIALEQDGSESIRVNHSVVAAASSSGPFIGQIGLSPRPTNFTNFEKPQSSFLSLLKDNQQISSLSYGYTAGASYRDNGNGVPGSLTLGGYDKSRFSPRNISFEFDPDAQNDLVVQLTGIEGLSSGGAGNSTVKFLSTPVQALVNSAVPHLWLPKEVCAIFASELGLTYNVRTNYYTIDKETRTRILKQNLTFTFTLSTTTSSSLSISIPWETFDLEYFPENYSMGLNYFPIRQAIDTPDSYILGRAFLQEVYMIVDYEQRRFSLHQAQFETEKDVVALRPSSGRSKQSALRKDSKKLIISLSIGIFATVMVLALSGYFLWERRRNKKAKLAAKVVEQTAWQKPEMDGVDARHETESHPVGPELDTGLRAELYGCEKMPHLLDGIATPVEMANDSAIHEASAGSTEDLGERTHGFLTP